MKRKIFVLIALIYCITHAQAAFCARLYPEKVYQRMWCENNGGKTEFVLPDNTRVDCLIDEYAVEFDFANKWAEALGQSLYYGLVTHKSPGIVLIIENEKRDDKYLTRLLKVARMHNITVWTISPSYLIK